MKFGIADKIALTVTIVAAVIVLSAIRILIRLGGFS